MTSVFDLIVNILTVIAGALAVVSISIVGVQYLRAGRSEASVKKTKQRMFEIIIGLTSFAVVTVILRWIQTVVAE
jgi:hypothetical protein